VVDDRHHDVVMPDAIDKRGLAHDADFSVMVIVESKLVQATRHVAKGRRIVAAQHALVAKKRAAGQDTAVAEDVLAQFERSLAIFESDLLAIQKEKDAK
jgi:hypothetical protein